MKKIVKTAAFGAILLLFPGCVSKVSLKDQKVVKMESHLTDNHKICPGTFHKIVATAFLESGEHKKISTNDRLSWRDLNLTLKNGYIATRRSWRTAEEQELYGGATEINQTPRSGRMMVMGPDQLQGDFLIYELHSKYHPEQIVKKRYPIVYNCAYQGNFSGRDGRRGGDHRGHGLRGKPGISGETVVVTIQKYLKKPNLLQVTAKSKTREKRYLIDPVGGRLHIDASGGDGGQGGSCSRCVQGGGGGRPGAGGRVTFLFATDTLQYQSLFTANVRRGEGGRGGRGYDQKNRKGKVVQRGKRGRDWRDGSVKIGGRFRVKVKTITDGKVRYQEADIPAANW